MSAKPFTALICPLDGECLSPEPSRWFCPQGHSFDIARQGHINLLPVQHKKAKDPGDSKAMVAARRDFLSLGHYQPIAKALLDAITATSTPNEPLRCLDAGCGEGYYLHELTKNSPHELELVGVDISKWAVLAAAKGKAHINWIVASNARLPIQDASLDYVFCLFGFPVYEEFARVLAPKGKLIMIDPAPEHLRELRQQLYPTITEKPEAAAEAPLGFTPIYHQKISHRFTLKSSAEIHNLLLMTPHWFKASTERREAVLALRELETALAVEVKVLEVLPSSRAGSQ